MEDVPRVYSYLMADTLMNLRPWDLASQIVDKQIYASLDSLEAFKKITIPFILPVI